jgi:hypothetical protein
MKIVQKGPENILNVLRQVPAQISRVQRDGIDQIAADYKDRHAALVLEQARLAALHGPRSDQARLAQAKVDRFARAGAALAAEVARADLPVPAANPAGFVVYGRVLARTGNAVPGLHVAAVNSQNASLGSGKTGDKGEFLFTVPVAPISGNPALNSGTQTQFRLQVSDRQQKMLLLATEVLEAVAGRMAYRELIVTAPATGTKPSRRQ